MSICQACLSEIQHAASVCPYCRSEFVNTGGGAVKPKSYRPNPGYSSNYSQNSSSDPDNIGGAVFAVFGLILIGYLIWLLLPVILTVFVCWLIYTVFSSFIGKKKKRG
jgi:hypothetical protein